VKERLCLNIPCKSGNFSDKSFIGKNKRKKGNLIMVNIAILGYGTVGSGVVEVIQTNYDSIQKKAGQGICIKYILDLRDFPNDPMQEKIVHDYDIILNDKEINIIVEVMGGLDLAYRFVKAALEQGKSVVTSNKELVAKYGSELIALAKAKNSNFLFEASVGGGIPIIRPLNQSLTADEICEIIGILNGTTNYILTKMKQDGSEFADALKEAQELGFAERDPSADIEGYDACRKIAILSSLAYGGQVDYEDIYTEGISQITRNDIWFTQKFGYEIKLLASSKKIDGKIYVSVAPALITEKNPLYSVFGVFNGIFVKGNVLGDVMFYGSGAGKLPTASAVVSDIVDEIKHLHTNIMTSWASKKIELGEISESKKKFFVRIEGKIKDRLEEIERIFGIVNAIEIEEIENEFAFITPILTEKEFIQKKERLSGICNRIRVESE
jgi:homoserine dehydrogenase